VAIGLLMLALAACQAPPAKEEAPQAVEAPRTRLKPEQIAVLKEQGFQLKDEGWEFDMSSKVLFGNDSDVLTPASRGNIERIGRALVEVQIDGLRLEGHTDSVGNPEYNQRLSVARASSVGKVLIAIGMRQENLDIRGLGMSKPVTDNKTAAGRQENRRVVIIVPGE
jgi:outer membrane protein OmpA-like peptidoglycan-associated protein